MLGDFDLEMEENMIKQPEQIYIESVMEPTIKELKKQIDALLKRVIELEKEK